MDIEIKLFAMFRKERFAEKTISFSDGALVRDVLTYLKIPQKEVGILLLNGRSARYEQKLNENDSISIFPAIAGG